MKLRVHATAFILTLLTCAGSRKALAESEPASLAGYTEGGLTSLAAASRAVRTSFTVQARSEQLRAAAAKLDEAVVRLLPRLEGTARYARLSNFTPSSITGSDTSIVATPEAPGSVNPVGIATAPPVVLNVLDNYWFQATLIVPLSDYPARLLPLRAAAEHEQEAAQYDLIATQARIWADARISFYSWLRARGAEALAAETLAVREAHAREAEVQFKEGKVSRPDHLRTVTALHAAKLALARAHEFALLSEDRVRTITHAPPSETLLPGERLETPVPAVDSSIATLSAQATDRRSELRSLREQTVAAERASTAAGAGVWPVLSAFGDLTYANPNPRRFPPADAWLGTWGVGLQLVWSPNDFGSGRARRAQEASRAGAIASQVKAAQDNVVLEVNEALRLIRTADDAIVTSSEELSNAREAYSAATALFAEGRFPSAVLSDAEEDLTRARLELLNARVDARIGRVRLAYALGDNVVASGTQQTQKPAH